MPEDRPIDVETTPVEDEIRSKIQDKIMPVLRNVLPPIRLNKAMKVVLIGCGVFVLGGLVGYLARGE